MEEEGRGAEIEGGGWEVLAGHESLEGTEGWNWGFLCTNIFNFIPAGSGYSETIST